MEKKLKLTPMFFTILIFIMFLIIGFLIPYTGDDWNNLIFHHGNINTIIKIARDNYMSFEGRFFSRIFDCIFNYYRPIWVLVNAGCMSFLYYSISKITNSKGKVFMSLLIIESLLLVDEETFSQVYVWITGNTTYFIPMIFMVLIIYINREIFDKKMEPIKYNKVLYIILPILSFINCMFVENVAVGIITVYLLIIIYEYIKTKKINILSLICLAFSIFATYLMLTSPGTLNRENTMDTFSKLNLIEKIMKTFPRQMNFVFIRNSFLMVLLIIIVCTIINRNFKYKKKYLLTFYMTFIPTITALENIYFILRSHGVRYLNVLLYCNNWYVLLYWLSFLAILLVLIIKYVKTDKYKLLFFFAIALINNGAMLISPLAGGRTSYLSTIMLFICALIIIDSLKIKLLEDKRIIKINKILCSLLIIFIILFYIFCNMLDRKRETYMYRQISEGKEVINAYMLPGKYLWNSNPWDEWHLYTFKKYYNIPENKRVVIKKIWECDL